MFHLIPAPLHRLVLRIAYRLRGRWRHLTGMPHDGISVIIRNCEDHVLLVRHSYGSGRWSLPGGGLRRGEDPEHCVRREMREELRCELEHIELFEVRERIMQGAPNRGHIFSAHIVGEPRIDGREILEAGWFRPDNPPHDTIALTRDELGRWHARYSKDS
ncbi:NUDIX domain-containing protein [Altererythrobacter salegens]|uniref:NUDIX domain-containing protein n=1 Tax=Croceibacterium salegens TaxID=1737568 RepID=A0A6I4SXR8_9SPHN|nr:NUDIX domain-containing protein [Croceibacterium salegens]MXO60139.1 NUDIX domain-containing protein [Croceibacterium salegens]